MRKVYNPLLLIVFACLQFFLFLTSNIQAKSQQHERDWMFNVYLDDNPIGYHHFQVKQKDKQRHIISKAKFDVKLLFLSVYKYDHENTEVWNNKCIKKLSSKTDNNGEFNFVNLHNNDASDKNNNIDNEVNITVVETSRGKQTFNRCIRSFAYWDLQLLKTDKVLNTQTGELVDIELNHIGPDTITLNGKDVVSEHYRLTGENIEIDLWYSMNNRWLALKSKTENGKNIYYKLQDEM